MIKKDIKRLTFSWIEWKFSHSNRKRLTNDWLLDLFITNDSKLEMKWNVITIEWHLISVCINCNQIDDYLNTKYKCVSYLK